MLRALYALLAVLILGYVAWPYASLYGLYADLKAADTEGVRGRADWPALRAGLTEDLDRFAKQAANQALAPSGGASGRPRFNLTWDSLPISGEIAAVFATPEGLIALHQNPKALSCALTALKTASVQDVAQCLKEQKDKDEPERREISLQGPNFARLWEKFDYAFFTGLFSFRVVVMHEGVPVTLELTRGAGGWHLVAVRVPFDRLAAPAGQDRLQR